MGGLSEKAGANVGREQTNLQLGTYYKIPKLDILSHLLRFGMSGPQNFGKKTPNLSKYDWMLGKTLLNWIGSLVGLEKSFWNKIRSSDSTILNMKRWFFYDKKTCKIPEFWQWCFWDENRWIFSDVLVSMVSTSGLGNRSIKCSQFFSVWVCVFCSEAFWNANIHYSRTKPNCSCLAIYIYNIEPL